jgi:hypothetical protein
MHTNLDARRDRITQVMAALLSLALVAVLVLRVSDAAFSATTDNTGSQWTAGDVVLTDDDSDTAMFAITAMKPGDTATECIAVTYSGSLDAAVKLYGTLTAGDGLDDYLDVTVRRGTGGSFGDCTGFSSDETVYSGTLDGFVGTHTSFGTGAGTWAPTGGGPDDTVTYQVEVTLQDDNAAQGKTATATFTWEAQNT